MKARGLPEEEIKKNLEALGVPNPDEVYTEAIERATEVQLPPVQAEEPKAESVVQPVEEMPKFEMTSISGEEEKAMAIGKTATRNAQAEADGLMTAMPKTTSGELTGKMDETIALLKALQDINKKILETNKEMLMRLKMK